MRDDNDLFRAFAVQRLYYRIEGQNGSLYLGFPSVPGHSDVGALLAIDLDRQSDRVFDQKLRFDQRPGLGGDQRLVAQSRPALLGEMRHHRVEQPNQNVAGLAQGPGKIRRWRGFGRADGVRQRIGELIDMGDAAVEAQFADIVGDIMQRAMGGLAHD